MSKVLPLPAAITVGFAAAVQLAWQSTALHSKFQQGWEHMTATYSLFQICVFGSAILHLFLSVVLNIWPIIVQNTPYFQQYKIQKKLPPASLNDWGYVIFWVLLSQLCVQLPLISGQYMFVQYFEIPYDYSTIPPWWDLAWRMVVCFICEDTWNYFLHRALHHKSIYRYIHKVHHTYTSPFALEAELAHPLETVILGTGFFVPFFLCNHLLWVWVWLTVRLVETFDIHSGYDIPYNPLKLIPGYAGARHHDFHHAHFNGNYASTFIWWDWLLGTDLAYNKHELNRRTADCQRRQQQMEAHGASLYPQAAATAQAAKHRQLHMEAKSLVTGAQGMVGQRLVKMLIRRGAREVVCLDVLPRPAVWPSSDLADLAKTHKCKLTYSQVDITDAAATAAAFAGVEVVFHVAALVGPFFPHHLYEKVNYQGTLNVIAACRAHSVPVLVDCTSPSTRFDGFDIEGKCESDLAYSSVHEYARTKALGEKAVLGANSSSLATVAVAPHQVYGPEDRLFLPAMLETAQKGRLRVFGQGGNVVSFTHVDNICHALWLAAQALLSQGWQSPAAGEFIVATDGDIRVFWDVIDSAVVECGMPSLHSKAYLPTPLLWALAYLSAAVTAVTGKQLKLNPFTLNMLLIHRYFSTSKAQQLLGYSPVVSFKDGWAETVAAAKARLDLSKQAATTAEPGVAEDSEVSDLSWLDQVLSPNPAKRAGEKFFLQWAVVWIAIMAAVVSTKSFEWMGAWHYLYVGAAIGVPCVAIPLVWPLRAEQHMPWWDRFSFKNNVWNFIVTFYGLWCWQMYFYVVLCTRYTFSVKELRFNNVPVALFLITQGYFTLYHTLSDMALRAYRRKWGPAMEVSTPNHSSSCSCSTLLRMAGFFAFVCTFSIAVAFTETFTIQNFPLYEIFDRTAMYLYGSVFYALYFVVSFPMHLGIDELPGQNLPLQQVVLNALASCAVITFLCDMWRIAIGPIVSSCPFEEAHLSAIPFIR